jgi:L-lactate utilization protein LutC
VSGKGDRRAFLARVGERVHGGLPDNPVRPLVPEGRPQPVAYAVDLDDRVGAFTKALEALTGVVEEASDRDALIRRVVADREVRRAVVSQDPECDGVEHLLRELGVEVVELGDVAGSAEADLGITGAAYGIALTGSLVIDSSRAGARTASLLPPTHLTLLRRETILPDPGALLRDLSAQLPDGLPSNLVLVTGPSKSADIELVLTVGVHGPRELVVGLL